MNMQNMLSAAAGCLLANNRKTYYMTPQNSCAVPMYDSRTGSILIEDMMCTRIWWLHMFLLLEATLTVNARINGTAWWHYSSNATSLS